MKEAPELCGGRATRPRRPGASPLSLRRGRGLGPGIVDGEAMFGREEVERHRLANAAGAEEPDVQEDDPYAVVAGLAGRAGQALWYQTEPSFTWLPFLRMRCLHFGHVPIAGLLFVEPIR